MCTIKKVVENFEVEVESKCTKRDHDSYGLGEGGRGEIVNNRQSSFI